MVMNGEKYGTKFTQFQKIKRSFYKKKVFVNKAFDILFSRGRCIERDKFLQEEYHKGENMTQTREDTGTIQWIMKQSAWL